MSSFLMNPNTSYLDPKFPPPCDDYGGVALQNYSDYYSMPMGPCPTSSHPHSHHQLYYHHPHAHPHHPSTTTIHHQMHPHHQAHHLNSAHSHSSHHPHLSSNSGSPQLITGGGSGGASPIPGHGAHLAQHQQMGTTPAVGGPHHLSHQNISPIPVALQQQHQQQSSLYSQTPSSHPSQGPQQRDTSPFHSANAATPSSNALYGTTPNHLSHHHHNNSSHNHHSSPHPSHPHHLQNHLQQTLHQTHLHQQAHLGQPSNAYYPLAQSPEDHLISSPPLTVLTSNSNNSSNPVTTTNVSSSASNVSASVNSSNNHNSPVILGSAGGGSGSGGSSNNGGQGNAVYNGVSSLAHLNTSNNPTNAQTPSPVSSVMSNLSLMSQGSGGGGSYLGGNVLSGQQHSYNTNRILPTAVGGCMNGVSNSSCDVVSVSNNSLTTGGCLTQTTPTTSHSGGGGGGGLGCNSGGSTHDLTSGSVGELSPGDGEDSNMSNNLASECMELDSDDDDDSEDKANMMIYPWMKKLHVGGSAGKIRGVTGSFQPGMEPKRQRTAYTRHQILELEKEFHYNRYLTRRRRIEIAHSLCLSERQIKIWFQNRRMKYKKDNKLPNTKNVRRKHKAAPPSSSNNASGGSGAGSTTANTSTTPGNSNARSTENSANSSSSSNSNSSTINNNNNNNYLPSDLNSFLGGGVTASATVVSNSSGSSANTNNNPCQGVNNCASGLASITIKSSGSPDYGLTDL